MTNPFPFRKEGLQAEIIALDFAIIDQQIKDVLNDNVRSNGTMEIDLPDAGLTEDESIMMIITYVAAGWDHMDSNVFEGIRTYKLEYTVEVPEYNEEDDDSHNAQGPQ